MSSPKLLAYKAVIEIASLLADIKSNPAALEEAGKAYASAFAMSDAEKTKRDEALKTIATAVTTAADLEQKKADFFTEVQGANQRLYDRKVALDTLEAEVNQKKADAETLKDHAEKAKKEASGLVTHAEGKEVDIATREAALAKSSEEFSTAKAALETKEKDVKNREDAVTLRENKIKEAFA